MNSFVYLKIWEGENIRSRKYKSYRNCKKYKYHVDINVTYSLYSKYMHVKNKRQHVTRDVLAHVLFHFYAAHRDFCSRQCSLRVSSLEDKECRRSSRNVYWSFHLPYIFALCSLVLHSLTTFTVSNFSFCSLSFPTIFWLSLWYKSRDWWSEKIWI